MNATAAYIIHLTDIPDYVHNVLIWRVTKTLQTNQMLRVTILKYNEK